MSQEGHYADGDHVNQDSCAVVEEFEKPGQALLGVYDGHGPNGHLVSRATRDSLPDQITRLGKAGKNKKINEPGAVEVDQTNYYKAFAAANRVVSKTLRQDANFSGTTAVTALVTDKHLYCANVGDSRAVMFKGGADKEEGAEWDVQELSYDQTCFRKDERARIKKESKNPVEFLSIAMRMGEVAIDEDSFGEETVEAAADPPRVFLKDHTIPATAFTRSIGDCIAKQLGVSANPEIFDFELDSDCKAFIICSDGVTEFLSNQDIGRIIQQHDDDPLEACREVVKTSFIAWTEYGEKVDDITAIVAFLHGAPAAKPKPKSKWAKVRTKFKRPSMGDFASKFREVVKAKMQEAGIQKFDKDATLESKESDWVSALGEINYDEEGEEEASPEKKK